MLAVTVARRRRPGLTRRSGQTGADGLGGEPERLPDRADVPPAVLGPGDSGGGEEQSAQQHPDAGGGVQGEGPAIPAGPQLRPHQVPPSTGAPSAPDPQTQPGHGDHAEPGGGELAVEATGVPQMQIPVEVVDPAAQRESTAGAVHSEVTAHLAGRRIEEDGAGLALGERVVAVHHARGAPGLGGRPHRGRLRVHVEVCLRCLHLRCQRKRRLVGRGGQGLGVDDLLELGAHGVERAAGRGDQQERAHQDRRVEMQAQQERAEPALR